jgi:four helix bundle protein
MAESILRDKSYLFAIRVVKLTQCLQAEKREFVLSKQLLRSGTAICALIKEAEFGQSKPDFINKLSVALKEANETNYWLSLLLDTDYIEKSQYKNITEECSELIKMLVSSLKTLKKSVKS